jgi:hypothetical protein
LFIGLNKNALYWEDSVTFSYKNFRGQMIKYIELEKWALLHGGATFLQHSQGASV